MATMKKNNLNQLDNIRSFEKGKPALMQGVQHERADMHHRDRSITRSTEQERAGAARKRFTRPVAALLVAAPLFLRAGGAQAAAPDNDLFSDATSTALEFSEVLDTSEATTDADDAQLNALCGAPATDASVWYAFTATTDGSVVVDVSQSDYSAGVLVGSGTQGNLQLEACGAGGVVFAATAGTTYYVLAIDDQFDGGGNGGSLAIGFTEVPPPPTIDVVVDPVGYVNAQTGVASLSGTYTCTGGLFIDVYGYAQQNIGRISTVTGYFGFSDANTCDGQPHAWSADVVPDSGKFAGGKALAVAFSFSCGIFACSDGFDEQTVQLKGGPKK